MKFNIITRCSRVNNLDKIKASIFQNGKYDIQWHILFDTTRLKDISAELLNKLDTPKIKLHFVSSNGTDYLYPQMSDLAKTFDDGFVVIVDDDNVVHHQFFQEHCWPHRQPSGRPWPLRQSGSGQSHRG